MHSAHTSMYGADPPYVMLNINLIMDLTLWHMEVSTVSLNGLCFSINIKKKQLYILCKENESYWETKGRDSWVKTWSVISCFWQQPGAQIALIWQAWIKTPFIYEMMHLVKLTLLLRGDCPVSHTQDKHPILSILKMAYEGQLQKHNIFVNEPSFFVIIKVFPRNERALRE